MNLQILFNTPQNPYLNQATQATQKNPKIKPCYLKSGVQSVPPLGLSHPLSVYLTQSVMLVKCWKPWNFTIYPRSTINWVYFKPRQCLKFLKLIIKKHFMLLEELNSRIHENGWLPCIIFWLPCHSKKKTQCTSLSRFLAFIQQLRPVFRGAWVPLTFFPASTLAVCHSLINFVYELKHCSTSTLGKCP